MPPRITALINQKGGVSKTTTCVNLAAVTHEALGGSPDLSPVGVVSTDPQNSSEFWIKKLNHLPFQHEVITNPDELIRLTTLPLRQILVDTPGNLDGPILRAVLDIVDDVLVPMPPHALAMDATARTVEDVLIPRQVPYRVFVSNWDPRTKTSRTVEGSSEEEQAQAYIQAQGWAMAKSSVRSYKVVSEGPLEGTLITDYPEAHRAATQSRNDYLSLALELGLGHPLTAEGM